MVPIKEVSGWDRIKKNGQQHSSTNKWVCQEGMSTESITSWNSKVYQKDPSADKQYEQQLDELSHLTKVGYHAICTAHQMKNEGGAVLCQDKLLDDPILN